MKCIYIASSGHSGSTLLDLILGAHSNFFSIGEINHLEEYIVDEKQCSCGKKVIECDFWIAVKNEILQKANIDIFKNPGAFKLNPIRKNLTNTIAKKLAVFVAKNNLRLFVRLFKNQQKLNNNLLLLYQSVSKVSGCENIVDSSKYLMAMKWLWLNKPNNVKMIYLHRDGRGVLLSNLKKNKAINASVSKWKTFNAFAMQLLKKVNKDKYIKVNYEKLCLNPAETLKEICSFLQVEYEPQMLSFRVREKHNIGGNRMRKQNDNQIKCDEKWKTELSAEALSAFENAAGSLNRKLGYN